MKLSSHVKDLWRAVRNRFRGKARSLRVEQVADLFLKHLSKKDVGGSDAILLNFLYEKNIYYDLESLQAALALLLEKNYIKEVPNTMAAMESAEAEAEARLENKRANDLVTEQDYQDQLYALKKKALDDQLQLLVAAGKGESEAAKKLRADMLKTDTDHVRREKDLKQSQFDFEHKMGAATAGLLKDGLQLVEDNISKQNAAYDILKAARKAAALAEIGINLNMELAYNAKNAAEMGPVIGIPALALMNGLSIGRAVLAGIKVAAFEKGGNTAATGNGNLADLAKWAGVLQGTSGGSFAPGGAVNQPTLGLIGEAGAELVIPNWLYSDPKQANLMGFLEAQIANRGGAFATGGTTVGPSPVMATEEGGADRGQLVGLIQQLVSSHQEFRDEISDWQRNFEVNLDPRKAKQAIDVAAQVISGGGLR